MRKYLPCIIENVRAFEARSKYRKGIEEHKLMIYSWKISPEHLNGSCGMTVQKLLCKHHKKIQFDIK